MDKELIFLVVLDDSDEVLNALDMRLKGLQ